MIEIKKYTSEDLEAWNNLVSKAKIDSFLFHRDFMDYHSDRFTDHSFLIYRKGKLEAALPGNISGDTYFSHQGLTYGGLLATQKITINDVLAAFDLIFVELKNGGIKKVVYKPVPLIYHKSPSQEDIYALFRNNASRIGCCISSTIFQKDKIPFIESRKSGIRKATKENVTTQEATALNDFWSILEHNMTAIYGTKPVHTVAEMTLLQSRFPANIKLYTCAIEGEIVGGSLLFITDGVIHVQYIAASERGKACGALDLLFDALINRIYQHVPIFDFGHSTEKLGTYLNENLIFQKEGFGGRGVVYDIYECQL